MVLLKMEETAAESYLGTTINDAVVTVLAYFNDCTVGHQGPVNNQRDQRRCYRLRSRQQVTSERNVLIVDLGGGTDVSLLTSEVKAHPLAR
jgi:molecular chaperone DnaK (HSP70)